MKTTQQEGKPVPRQEPEIDMDTSAWQHYHVLDLDDFTPEEIELVFRLADIMRKVMSHETEKLTTLKDKTVVNLFYEASTRTRISFEAAAINLSATVVNVTASASSVTKGESLLDTFTTLEALGADIVVMRHSQAGAPYTLAKYVRANILNGGDGRHAHPTQGLLDLYTMRLHKGNLKGLKAVILGDIIHGRVASSNVWGMTKMGMEVTLCGPPTLMPIGIDKSGDAFPMVKVEYNIDAALEGADIVMALRLQRERQQGGLLPSIREYAQLFQLNEERLARAKPDALVMHPGPMNEGIEISPEVAHGVQSVIDEQVTNGVAVRMALLYLLGRSKE